MIKMAIEKKDFTIKDIINYCILAVSLASMFFIFRGKVENDSNIFRVKVENNSNDIYELKIEIENIKKELKETDYKVINAEIKSMKEDIADIKNKTDVTLDNLNKFIIDYYKNRK
jgi:gas vesicle protein